MKILTFSGSRKSGVWWRQRGAVPACLQWQSFEFWLKSLMKINFGFSRGKRLPSSPITCQVSLGPARVHRKVN